MEQKFKIGDVVTLKSGGVPMTIVNDKLANDLLLGETFNGYYHCSWFEGTKNKRGNFSQDSLEPKS